MLPRPEKTDRPGKERGLMKRRGGALIAIVIIAGLIAYACIALSNMRSKVEQAGKTETELRAQIEEIQEENAALQYAIDNQNDPDTIEDIARDKLGLVMPDEQIFYDAGE
jgi:cell division protein FtsL